MPALKNKDFYRRPNIIVSVVIVSLIAYGVILAFAPAKIPFDKLGPIGSISKTYAGSFLLQLSASLTILAHVLEAGYSAYKAYSCGFSTHCVLYWAIKHFYWIPIE